MTHALRIQASADAERVIRAVAGGSLVINAAASADGKPSPAKLDLLAYGGGPLNQWWSEYPIVVDLATLKASREDMPILRDHSASKVVGHTTAIQNDGKSLKCMGVASAVNEYSAEVVASSQNGYPWQVSMGADPGSLEFVKAGTQVEVNGKTFSGPVYVARNSTLVEVSIVAVGADTQTSGKVAATGKKDNKDKGADMKFEAWLAAKGFDANTITAEQKATLLAAYNAEQVKPDAKPEVPQTFNFEAEMTKLRAEQTRLLKIETKFGGKFPELKARAISEGWDEQRISNEFELADLRASRPNVPAFITGNAKDGPDQGKVIEASMLVRAGMKPDQVAKEYGDKVMDAATRQGVRAIGLHSIMHRVITAAGLYAEAGNVGNDFIRTAFEADRRLRAGGDFTNISLAGLLGNASNKLLLTGFYEIATIADQIASATDVPDFKVSERYRLSAIGRMQKVAPNGELKNTALAQEKFTNQASTVGEVLTLDRTAIINDDLGAFLALPRLMGRKAAATREYDVFNTLLAGIGSFFASGNGNNLTGGGSALSIAGVTAAEKVFLDRKGVDGLPVLITPSILLVAPANKRYAEQICKDQYVNETTTANAPKPASNPHAGNFKALSSTFWGAGQGLTNGIDAHWLLMADPNVLAAVDVVYVKGQRTPVIESGDPDFDTLGMSFRGYYDYGVALQDTKAAVRSAGS